MPNDAPTGHPDTRLIVVRGNSGSGKSTVARRLRLGHGRGCALVEQDHLRRVVLRERDLPGGLAPDLIAQVVRFALDHRYHVILEGILFTGHYAPMLAGLWRAHRGGSWCFYLDVDFDETVRRHGGRPQRDEFTAEDMRGWYRRLDLLGFAGERVVAQESTVDETVALIAAVTGLPQDGCDEDVHVRRP
ncbi:kinase [Dactylosporangium aurantiacum]|uniref:Kinase n=1 Tax=Dactylosporangium aurantiacum TaxID=35754 RepID=A0A9Q9MF36_9ACTN|nr:kinase [Dactylosporangium aurantiacum]MDG6105486.1 kinase [Dactylosporangium aurantiacum]UWZ53979.1 kinase [Dactylosporangium aurantiacum]